MPSTGVPLVQWHWWEVNVTRRFVLVNTVTFRPQRDMAFVFSAHMPARMGIQPRIENIQLILPHCSARDPPVLLYCAIILSTVYTT